MEYFHKVSIVIPVYSQWHLVKRNVDACLNFDNDFIEEILIIDDCSPTGNPYIFPEKISLIKNRKNKGYTGTVNEGLKRAKSEIIILLDSDAYPVRPFIEKLINIYSSNNKVGCVGFSTVDENGKSTGNFQYPPTVAGWIIGQKMEEKLVRLLSLFNKRILPYSCAVSFRKTCLENMSYFDETNFPVLDADNDLSLRIHQSSWVLVFSDKIIICHKGGNSILRDYKRVLLFYESRWRLLKKHNMLVLPGLIKFLFRVRILLEITFIKISLPYSQNETVIRVNKLDGRRMLFKAVLKY